MRILKLSHSAEKVKRGTLWRHEKNSKKSHSAEKIQRDPLQHLVRFPGICLVDQTEKKFRRIRVCRKEKQTRKKTSDCDSRALLLIISRSGLKRFNCLIG